MALTETINYTPFNKQSFNFSNELATNWQSYFPNPTSVVDMRISYFSGILDDDGHISTPSYGSAVSTYDKQTRKWRCKGERDEVDQVLNQLYFYPSPQTSYINWTVDDPIENNPVRAVNTTTRFTDSPPSLSDTVFEVYEYVNSANISGYKTFDATPASYTYYYPYMANLPTTESRSSLQTIDTLDFGELGTQQMNDNLTITVESYDSFNGLTWSNLQTSNTHFFYYQDVYVGDKKAETPQGNEMFRFTGNVSECQAFLDSVTYQKSSACYFKLTITDGISSIFVSKQLT